MNSRVEKTLLIKQRRLRHTRRARVANKRAGLVGMGLGALFSLLLFGGMLLAGLAYASLTRQLPSLESLPLYFDAQNGSLLQPTRLYDRSGQTLIAEIGNPGIPRRVLPLDPAQPEHLSPLLAQTVVLLEDPDFWQHSGAHLAQISDPQPRTLAEKLALDLLLEDEAPGLRRTLRMRLLAAQITARFGRAQVLEWYLNSAYFGHLAYGAESAARLYLGKSAQELTLAEAVLLAAVAQAPAVNPIDSPEGAADLQAQALERLAASGQFAADELRQARLDPAQFLPAPPQSPSLAPAFTQLVLQDLEQRFGRQRVERGGLEIRTTLDLQLQQSLACATSAQLQRLTGSSRSLPADCPAARLLPTLPPGSLAYPPGLAGSGIILNAQTGEILALIGDTRLSGEDSALPRHQPGSLLAPFVALSAVSRGQSPASLVWDLPAYLPASASQPAEYHGPQRLRLAVANDYLAALYHLLEQYGAANVWRLAEPLGLSSLSAAADPQALLLEGGSLSLVELAQSYSVFANLGLQTGQPDASGSAIAPLSVLSAADLSGRPLISPQPAQKRAVISAEVAYLVHHILQDETARWPSLGQANPLEIGRPSAGKTGQANAGREVWSAGYTPQRVVITWLGLPAEDAAPPLQPKLAAGLWYALMQEATRDLPAAQWEQPAGVSAMAVCSPSGLLPTQDCPSIVNEVFLTGSEPTELDSLYRRVQINRETGALATVFTPLEMIEEQTFMVLPPEAQDWAQQAGVPQPPASYDVIQPPAALPGAQIVAPAMFAFVSGQVSVRGSASGADFDSYRLQAGQGLNPRTWVQIGETGSQPVENGLLAMWDTTASPDGLYALRLLVTRADKQVQTAVLQVTVDNTPPGAQITFPVAGQVVSAAAETALLQASVEDNLGVQRVEWLLDGSLLSESNQAPYAVAWQPARGDHRLQVRVTDLAGNVSESEIVELIVK